MDRNNNDRGRVEERCCQRKNVGQNGIRQKGMIYDLIENERYGDLKSGAEDRQE